MPTYQYTCTDCGTPLEAVQSFSDDALTVCPTCSGRLRKVYSAVGVVFKGSGFYKNDSRPKEKTSSGKEGASKESGSKETSGTKESSPPAKSDGGGDKPATKKEPAAKAAPASKPAST